MWVDIVRADVPSLNNNVYPESTLRTAALLPPCPVYPAYGKAVEEGGFVYTEPQIAQTLAYRFEDGWLQAQLYFFCPHFANQVKDGHSVVRAAIEGIMDQPDGEWGVRRLVLSISKIDHLALCSPLVASWCIDGACKTSSAPSQSPASTSTPT